jgi:hypothetical protein
MGGFQELPSKRRKGIGVFVIPIPREAAVLPTDLHSLKHLGEGRGAESQRTEFLVHPERWFILSPSSPCGNLEEMLQAPLSHMAGEHTLDFGFH